jgi:hypothetical protein
VLGLNAPGVSIFSTSDFLDLRNGFVQRSLKPKIDVAQVEICPSEQFWLFAGTREKMKDLNNLKQKMGQAAGGFQGRQVYYLAHSKDSCGFCFPMHFALLRSHKTLGYVEISAPGLPLF